jgi:y4mF family transcriptional regulator
MAGQRRSTAELNRDIGPIALFVRQQRKELGYTQEEFALRVGVGIRFLKDLETGKPTVRLDKTNQVLNFLGAEVVPGPLHREVEGAT